jgi:cytochrome oxidase Cu insertion factor (SCO1/SenC/PrrC family)
VENPRGNALNNSNTLPEEDEDSWDIKAAPVDPGKRKALASMVASSKQEPRWLKEFEFEDQLGRKISTETLRGQPYVACFFFTTCKGSCPRQTSQMQLLQNKFKDKPLRFVSITVDPEIDTREILAEYAESFQANPERWYFLRGEMDYTERVGVEKFFLDGVEKRGHPDRFCLVNAEGDIVGSYVWLDVDERELLLKHIAELVGG